MYIYIKKSVIIIIISLLIESILCLYRIPYRCMLVVLKDVILTCMKKKYSNNINHQTSIIWIYPMDMNNFEIVCTI